MSCCERYPLAARWSWNPRSLVRRPRRQSRAHIALILFSMLALLSRPLSSTQEPTTREAPNCDLPEDRGAKVCCSGTWRERQSSPWLDRVRIGNRVVDMCDWISRTTGPDIHSQPATTSKARDQPWVSRPLRSSAARIWLSHSVPSWRPFGNWSPRSQRHVVIIASTRIRHSRSKP
jgi:hypothetical protein